MSVGGVGRGGGRGGAKGPGGPKGPGGTGSTFKVTGNDAAGKTESLVGASRAAGTGEAGAVASTDPVTLGAAEIARGLRDGTIASKSEATQRLVHLILERQKLLGKDTKTTQKLVQQIADTLQDDPRLAAALERTWSRTAGKK